MQNIICIMFALDESEKKKKASEERLSSSREVAVIMENTCSSMTRRALCNMEIGVM